MRFYVLIEFNGNGSGEIVRMSNDKQALLNEREYTLTVKQAKRKYYTNYFFKSDVPCSEISIYKSEFSYKKGKEPINVISYY